MEINIAPQNHVAVDDRWKRLYSFTTENISGFFDLFPKGHGNALTVCGSGDHIINLALSGKETITAIDVNPEALFFAALKLSALSLLSFEEFLAFFMTGSDTAFSHPVFEKMCPSLPPEAAAWFETRYAEAGFNGLNLRHSLFNLKHDIPETKRLSNPYLHSLKSYSSAKSCLQSAGINLSCCAAQNTDFRLPGSPYDVILLSNLADHAPKYFGNETYLETFVELVIKPAICNLRPGGKLFAAYLYDVSLRNGAVRHSDVDDPERRKKVMTVAGVTYREYRFDSVIPGRKDGVVVLANE